MVTGMEADFEQSYWIAADKNVKQALREIKEFIDYLENAKRELVLASARLSSDGATRFIGPSAEVAVTGIIHAINYLEVCRSRIKDTDLVTTTRSLASLEI